MLKQHLLLHENQDHRLHLNSLQTSMTKLILQQIKKPHLKQNTFKRISLHYHFFIIYNEKRDVQQAFMLEVIELVKMTPNTLHTVVSTSSTTVGHTLGTSPFRLDLLSTDIS